ncbi:MAG: extracellular solute-binding protein [Chloroflexi bacterium]|nr:extracellular solute-binding protein [Chloroflexota bacterium]
MIRTRVSRASRLLLSLFLVILVLPSASLAGPSREAAAQEAIEVVQIGLTQNYPNFPELLALFAKQEPNIKIVQAPQSGGSGSTLARLKTEGENTQVSLVFFGQALGPQFRDADVLAPIQPTGAEFLLPTDHDPNGLYYSWALWTPAFIYNKDQMANPPKSYADLPNAEGRISYDNPVTSASGMIFLVGAILANGGTIENPEPGFEYLKKLRSKITTYPSSGGESLSLVQKGELGLIVHYSEANLYNKYFENAPIEVVVPKEGMPLSALSVGVAKYAPQAEAAKKFVDFLLTPEAQNLLASRYFRPARTDITVPAEVRANYPENYEAGYPFDWDSILPYQKAWLDRWNAEIK